MRQAIAVIALVLAGALGSACGKSDRASAPVREPRPAPDVRMTLDADGVAAIAVTADGGAIVEADATVWLIRGDRTRQRLGTLGPFGQVWASASSLALMRTTLDGTLSGPYLADGSADGPPPVDPSSETTVTGGPLDGAQAPLVRCRGAQAQAALERPLVATGDGVVAAATCDRRGIVLRAGPAPRTEPVDGTVLAVAAAGHLVSWVAQPARGAKLDVTTLDLGDGTRRTQEAALPVPAEGALVRLDVAADGRRRASVTQPSVQDAVTGREPCVVSTTADGATEGTAGRERLCATVRQYVEDGSLDVTWGGLGLLVLRDRDGRARRALDRWDLASGSRSFAAAGARVAVVAATCTAWSLRVTDVDRFTAPPAPDCPLTVRGRRWRADAEGVVRVTVRCPSGCRLARERVALGFASRPRFWHPRRSLVIQPGHSGTLTFALGRRLRGGGGRAMLTQLHAGGGYERVSGRVIASPRR